MKLAIVAAAFSMSVFASGVFATSISRVACVPYIVEGCAIARYSVRTSDQSLTANVSLISLEPDGALRPWAECIAAMWRSFEPFNQPSLPGTRIVDIRFESPDCKTPAK